MAEFLKIFLLIINLMIFCDGTFGVKNYHCEYKQNSWTYWPTHKYCRVSGVRMSTANRNETFTFSGSESEKIESTAVYLDASTIDFITLDILREFPSLNGLEITRSTNLQTVRNGLFTPEFKKLVYLNLENNAIHTIELEAFKELVNLKYLHLGENNLRRLPLQIFDYNTDLNYLNFRYNLIDSMTPNLFKNLNYIRIADFFYNKGCAWETYGCEECGLSVELLNQKFDTCFRHCYIDSECASQIVIATTEAVEHTTKKKEFNEEFSDLQNSLRNQFNELKDEIRKMSINSETVATQTIQLLNENTKLAEEIRELKLKSQDMKNRLKKIEGKLDSPV